MCTASVPGLWWLQILLFVCVCVCVCKYIFHPGKFYYFSRLWWQIVSVSASPKPLGVCLLIYGPNTRGFTTWLLALCRLCLFWGIATFSAFVALVLVMFWCSSNVFTRSCKCICAILSCFFLSSCTFVHFFVLFFTFLICVGTIEKWRKMLASRCSIQWVTINRSPLIYVCIYLCDWNLNEQHTLLHFCCCYCFLCSLDNTHCARVPLDCREVSGRCVFWKCDSTHAAMSSYANVCENVFCEQWLEHLIT